MAGFWENRDELGMKLNILMENKLSTVRQRPREAFQMRNSLSLGLFCLNFDCSITWAQTNL